MPAIPVKVGNTVFPSKKDADTAIGKILWSYKPGMLGGRRVNEEHQAILRDLIHLHPEAAEKIGAGIDHFEVRPNAEGDRAGQGFWIVRTDGSGCFFSYRKCIDGKSSPPAAKFRVACRQAILSHITEEKNRFFAEAESPTCAITGQPITYETADVDHAPPYTFARIVAGFIALHDINADDTALVDDSNVAMPTLADPVMRDRFVQFHNNHAKLRVISIRANQRIVPQVHRNGGKPS
jgi:hypothetical protein